MELIRRALLAAAWVACACALSAQTLQQFSVVQAVSRPTRLTAYLDARITADAAATGLRPQDLRATLDGTALPVRRLTPFARTGEGVAFTLMIDTSGSESNASFARIKEAVDSFIDGMQPHDQAAVLAFGDRVTIVAQYSADRNALKEAVNGLQSKDRTTHLYAGFLAALDLARRRDEALPLRREIVVLSDGKDEGSGLEAEDVLHRLDEEPVPVYALGVSTLRAAERARYLNILRRFAVLSGGAYYDVDPSLLQDVYHRVLQRTAESWAAEFDCSSCLAGGMLHHLQLELTDHGTTLGAKANVPPMIPAPQPAPAAPAKQVRTSRFSRRTVYAVAAATILLVALAIFFAVRISRRKQAKLPPEPPPYTVRAGPGVLVTGPDVSAPRAASVADTRPGMCVELVRMGSVPALPSTYRGKLVDTLLVGRAAEAGLRVDDPQVSSRHCTLTMNGGIITLADNRSTHGTTLNGVPLSSPTRLEAGDTLALGPAAFRVRIEPC